MFKRKLSVHAFLVRLFVMASWALIRYLLLDKLSVLEKADQFYMGETTTFMERATLGLSALIVPLFDFSVKFALFVGFCKFAGDLYQFITCPLFTDLDSERIVTGIKQHDPQMVATHIRRFPYLTRIWASEVTLFCLAPEGSIFLPTTIFQKHIWK